jgi:hypothetical protein
MMAQKKAAKSSKKEVSNVAPTKDAAAPAGKMKKDGTPDKRYKENKEAKPAEGPKKKDGTTDKRYNANKGK